MKLIIGSDHGGFALKESLLAHFLEQGCDIANMGCFSEESVDYPLYAFKVAQAVAAGEKDFGILVCTTGIGMSIAANKVKGARAALCSNELAARLSRNHNNANILVLGARFVDSANAKRIAGIFLESSFDGGRHDRRVGMIDNYQTFFDTEGQ